MSCLALAGWVVYYYATLDRSDITIPLYFLTQESPTAHTEAINRAFYWKSEADSGQAVTRDSIRAEEEARCE